MNETTTTAPALATPAFDTDALAWDKQDGLLPAVVQDADSLRVLMVGYMSREALAKTLDSGQVTFFSRSKGRLWTKGESSGHVLSLVRLEADCDRDTLLVQARPQPDLPPRHRQLFSGCTRRHPRRTAGADPRASCRSSRR
jgi:phosphoribosyl-ATP pyrophosphohydrolase/phosphoribosyl-AMP cyclohydrolase